MNPVKVFKALANDTRLAMLRHLASGPLRFIDIARLTYGTKAVERGRFAGKLTHHLRVLREAGLVKNSGGRYCLTELGECALQLAGRLEGRARITTDPIPMFRKASSVNPRQAVGVDRFSDPDLLALVLVEKREDSDAPKRYMNVLLTPEDAEELGEALIRLAKGVVNHEGI